MATSRYNIMTLYNSAYMKFANLFLETIIRQVKMDNLGKIYIVDTGLRKEEREILKRTRKVVIIKGNLWNPKTSDIAGKHCVWHEHVNEKTKQLRKLIEKRENVPIVLIDGDTAIMRDFSDLIDRRYDIQVCRRDKIRLKKEKWIASFVVINSWITGKMFLDEWIETIKKFQSNPRYRKKWFETPALCQLVTSKYKRYKIGEIEMYKVSAEKKINEETRIVHLKGDLNKTNIDNRLNSFYKLINA